MINMLTTVVSRTEPKAVPRPFLLRLCPGHYCCQQCPGQSLRLFHVRSFCGCPCNSRNKRSRPSADTKFHQQLIQRRQSIHVTDVLRPAHKHFDLQTLAIRYAEVSSSVIASSLFSSTLSVDLLPIGDPAGIMGLLFIEKNGLDLPRLLAWALQACPSSTPHHTITLYHTTSTDSTGSKSTFVHL
jgi:hypothetical protein